MRTSKRSIKDESNNYFAKLNLYSHMAHYVAKELCQRPNDILDHWSVPELVIAYGQYTNEIASQNYREWKQMGIKEKKRAERPEEYHVHFYSPDDLQE